MFSSENWTRKRFTMRRYQYAKLDKYVHYNTGFPKALPDLPPPYPLLLSGHHFYAPSFLFHSSHPCLGTFHRQHTACSALSPDIPCGWLIPLLPSRLHLNVGSLKRPTWQALKLQCNAPTHTTGVLISLWLALLFFHHDFFTFSNTTSFIIFSLFFIVRSSHLKTNSMKTDLYQFCSPM